MFAHLTPLLPMRALRPFIMALLTLGAYASSSSETSSAAVAPTLATLPLASDTTEPTIVALHGRRVVVNVPEGFSQVTLQSYRRRPAHKKAAGPEWRTVSTRAVNKQGEVVTFRLVRATTLRNLRVKGVSTQTLPENLLTGYSKFLGDPVGFTTHPTVDSGPLNLTSGSSNSADSSASGSSGSDSRSVVESDIWKVSGNRLYYFNSIRGLQVFDVTTPDSPALLGTLRLPGAGEDMYLLDKDHVALLKTDGYWSWTDEAQRFFPYIGITNTANLSISTGVNASASLAIVNSNNQASQSAEIIIADVSAGNPTLVAQVPYEGYLVESRLVGSVLYLATEVYGSARADGLYEYGCQLSSFDVSDPSNPVARDSVLLDSYPGAVAATDQYFLVATWNSETDGQQITLVDISDPQGLLHLAGHAAVPGYVGSKFDLTTVGNSLVVASTVYGQDVSVNTDDWTPHANVSAFSLADPLNPAASGSIDFAQSEYITATRFDGSRLYVVTVDQKSADPLYIVDLSNLSQLSVVGSLKSPGFSTYIQPLGNRLVTIGLVSDRPTVSLFDVTDPKHLTQLSTAAVGGTAKWSYSEAVWDEKAFNVLPENHLILLPYSGYDSTGEASGIQLVDLFTDHLATRGVIQHDFSPRRSTVIADRIVSISPEQLVTVNAQNRDHPSVTAALAISYPVDRIIASGDYLLEIADGSSWLDQAPKITVAATGDPNQALSVLPLSAAPITGATVRNGVLYILQSQVAQPTSIQPVTSANSSGSSALLSTFDLSSLPTVRPLGKISPPNEMALEGDEFQPLWVTDTTLVWTGQRRSYFLYPVFFATDFVTNHFILDPYFSTSGKRLYAFDVSDAAAPIFASKLAIGVTEKWDVSEPFAANGAVYISHKVSPSATPLNSNFQLGAPTDPLANRHFLEIIDYSDPTAPFIHPDMPNIPGELHGLSMDGQLLYTVGQAYDLTTGAPVNTGPTNINGVLTLQLAQYALHVSSCDGVTAHLLDQLRVNNPSQPFLLSGETLFLLHPNPNPGPQGGWLPIAYSIASQSDASQSDAFSTLESWTLGSDGKFKRLSNISLQHENTFVLFGDLAVLHGYDAAVHLLNVQNPSSFSDLGIFNLEGSGSSSLLDAAGDLKGGLWLPVGDYGVDSVPFNNSAN